MALVGQPVLYLASASPRRQALLKQMDLSFQIVDVQVDESVKPNESPRDYVKRLAEIKALAGAKLTCDPEAWVVGGDTVVVLNHQILGKPRDEEDAQQMLSQLSGKVHLVLSAVAVAHQGEVASCLQQTEVEFAALDSDWIASYVASGEPLDKAGAYAIQGAAARYIKKINGSFYAVMGLPLYELDQLLQHRGFVRAGIDLTASAPA
ncbi:MAG: septum formation inhibitor Maf [Thiotrichales bacterium]|nr:septum formation inhibitor Maf [Thiotrichales bacterium]